MLQCTHTQHSNLKKEREREGKETKHHMVFHLQNSKDIKESGKSLNGHHCHYHFPLSHSHRGHQK
jgi:hypothetical protein